MKVPSSEPKKTRRPRITKADYGMMMNALQAFERLEQQAAVDVALDVFKDFGADCGYAELVEYCKENGITMTAEQVIDDVNALVGKLAHYV